MCSRGYEILLDLTTTAEGLASILDDDDEHLLETVDMPRTSERLSRIICLAEVEAICDAWSRASYSQTEVLIQASNTKVAKPVVHTVCI